MGLIARMRVEERPRGGLALSYKVPTKAGKGGPLSSYLGQWVTSIDPEDSEESWGSSFSNAST